MPFSCSIFHTISPLISIFLSLLCPPLQTILLCTPFPYFHFISHINHSRTMIKWTLSFYYSFFSSDSHRITIENRVCLQVFCKEVLVLENFDRGSTFCILNQRCRFFPYLPFTWYKFKCLIKIIHLKKTCRTTTVMHVRNIRIQH